MAWKIELSPEARKDLSKMGATEAKRVLNFLHRRLRLLDDPRSIGKSLKGPVFRDCGAIAPGIIEFCAKFRMKKLLFWLCWWGIGGKSMRDPHVRLLVVGTCFWMT